MDSVWVLRDDTFVDVYRNEKDARREWLALVDAIKANRYYVADYGAKTSVDLIVDENDMHYCIFKSYRSLQGEEMKCVAYGLHKIK